MNLGQKIVVLFLLLAVSFCIGSYIALELVVSPAFTKFERESADNAAIRVGQAIEANLHAVEIFNLEYSQWDHTYQYANGQRPEYADENLDPEYWHSVDIDLMMIFDAHGKPLYTYMGDPDTGDSLRPEDELAQPLLPGHPLLSHKKISDVTSGFLLTRSGLMQVMSAPILTSNSEGPVAGSLLTGQFIDENQVNQLSDRATADVSISLLRGKDTAPSIANVVLRMTNSGTTNYFDTTDSLAREYRLLRDVMGTPVAVLQVNTPRRITQIGAASINTAIILLATSGTVFLVAALLFMRRLIIAPVRRLTQAMLGMEHAGDLQVKNDIDRSDELGALTREFKRLASRLARAQQASDLARDEALALSRTKSEFLARMSHEIRTPMNGVLGMTELLQNTQLDNRQQRFTKTIYESAESLLGIISDILDFSKIEAGKLQLDLVDTDLDLLVEETLDSLAIQAYSKGLELNYAGPSGLRSTVQVDPGRLRQVLTNLLGNAIKFTEKGEVTLRVTTSEVETDNVELFFEIEDTGIGIKPEAQKVIFESFEQEDASTTRLFGGTGLGLAICKQLIELMGGTLDVASTAGKGSTFSFRLLTMKGGPVRVNHPDQLHCVAGNRVLIVDDNVTNLEILEHQLTGWRAHTDSATSASTALTALESAVAAGKPHDLAILDMHMPETDGLELARAIRGNPDLESLKLVMLSSVVTPASDDDLKQLGIAGQLTKPIRQSRLYDTLAVVLSSDAVAQTHTILQGGGAKRLSGHVLLVEDNPVNQAVTIGMLETLGLTMTVAATGHEAVEQALTGAFDVVLMDCQMPGMDGFEATGAIRQAELESGWPPATVIAVTANALEGDRGRCLQAGMDDYLSKPFTIEQLHATLAAYLRAGQAVAPEASAPETVKDDSSGRSTPDESPIDTAVLEDLARLQQPGAPSILGRVIDIYLDSAEGLKSRLRAAIDTANAALLREVAHALKSSSANVGAKGLADLCRRLEIMGREDKLSDAPTIHERFEREYARVRAALKIEAGRANA